MSHKYFIPCLASYTVSEILTLCYQKSHKFIIPVSAFILMTTFHSGPDFLRRQVIESREQTGVSHVKLDFTSVNQIDYTVLQGLEELATELNSQGVELHIINPQPQIRKYLQRAKLKHIDIQDAGTLFALGEPPRSSQSDPLITLATQRYADYNSIP